MLEGRIHRRLAAILAADVAGYSRLIGVDEVGTLRALKTLRREVVDPAIAEHQGRIVKTTGDLLGPQRKRNSAIVVAVWHGVRHEVAALSRIG